MMDRMIIDNVLEIDPSQLCSTQIRHALALDTSWITSLANVCALNASTLSQTEAGIYNGRQTTKHIKHNESESGGERERERDITPT